MANILLRCPMYKSVIMLSKKYYDHQRSCPIDLNKDGCDLNNWKKLFGKALFAKHHKGFLVFLPPNKLESSNEYKESDPYTMNVDSDFHKRRIECTLEMIREAAREIQIPPRILDLGCGKGYITAKIKQANPDSDISALDYSLSAIEYAFDHFHEIDFVVGDAYESPYAENYFDIIVCNNLWEHVPDPLFLLNRISKIIKPSGFLLISTPSRYRLGNLLRVIRGKTVSLISEHHVTEYSVGQVFEQLHYGGFKIVRCFSKPLKKASFKAKIANMLFSFLILLTGSHHKLESTLFYLSQRIDKKGDLDKTA